MNQAALPQTKKKRNWMWLVFLILAFAGALVIRLYDLTDLPLDFHSGRQLQSMLKARGMFAASGEYYPQWQTQEAIADWKSLPTEEPEIVEHLALATYRLIGREDLWFPRFYSIVFWLVGGVGLYLLLKRMVSLEGAVIGTTFYLFAPYGISASRTFMPDPLMIAALLWSLWALYRWSEKPGWGRALLAGVLCGLTIYIKLTAVFYLGGVILGLALGGFGFKKVIRSLQFWAIGLLALLPGVLYNVLGIYVFKFIGSDALSNRLIPAMLVKPVTYLQWNSMIVTVIGAAVFLLGFAGIFLLDSREKRALMLGWWAGYLVFGVFFIYYYTTHDYYHLALIPMAAVGLAAIGDAVVRRVNEAVKPAGWAQVLMVLVLVGCAAESAWQVRNDLKRTDYRGQVQFWQKLGDELRGTNPLAMADDYNGRLAYYGWCTAAYMPDLAELNHRALAGHGGDIEATFQPIAKGRSFFLVTELDDLNSVPAFKAYLDKTYPIYDQGTGYIIYDLRQEK